MALRSLARRKRRGAFRQSGFAALRLNAVSRSVSPLREAGGFGLQIHGVRTEA
jgi:hypothetical protein